NTVGAAEENGAASAGTVGEAEDNEAASAETVGAAETNASTYNNHYYKIYSNKAATFDSAEKYCETLGGHLATITSEEENEAVYQGIKKSGYSNAFLGYIRMIKTIPGTGSTMNRLTLPIGLLESRIIREV
ncbi:MAG: C-type lectin domain-containing protein, partial [Eubacterium sp.]